MKYFIYKFNKTYQIQDKNHNLGAPALTVSDATFSYLLKLSLNISATLCKVYLNSYLFFHELAGFKILLSTPLIYFGYDKLNIGSVSIFELDILLS
jgi:hypothetical protein